MNVFSSSSSYFFSCLLFCLFICLKQNKKQKKKKKPKTKEQRKRAMKIFCSISKTVNTEILLETSHWNQNCFWLRCCAAQQLQQWRSWGSWSQLRQPTTVSTELSGFFHFFLLASANFHLFLSLFFFLLLSSKKKKNFTGQ